MDCHRGDILLQTDDALLANCDVHTYKASGPGGQHRNKVSSAVRLKHRPTGVMAHGDDSRSQHENKRLALKRLRMNLAIQLRNPVGQGPYAPSPTLAECIFTPKKAGPRDPNRLEIGRKDHRFWTVAGELLDLLDSREGRLSDVAAELGITTSNFIRTLKADRHLLAAAQQVRQAHGHAPIK